MRKTIGIIILILNFTLTLKAQSSQITDAFSKIFEIVHEKSGKEKFKGQILKGKRNGMGVISYKDGSVYVGDFYRNSISGFGALFASHWVENCDSCLIYVGNWKDGKKNGYGTCYNHNGHVIYQGQFVNDKPTGDYPNTNHHSQKYFSIVKLDNSDIFLGEMKDCYANGFGILIFCNGNLWQGNYKNGQRKGIGLYLTYDGEWQTINFNEQNYDVVSSSENYKAMDAKRKENFNNALSGAMGYFAEAATQAMDILSGGTNTTDNNNLMGDTTISDDDNVIKTSGSANKKSNNSTTKTNGHTGSEAQAKNRDSNTYSDYESQLIKMNTYWEKQYNDNQRRNIQKKMKEIRTKWESRGFRMQHSSWEDWNGKKR